MASERFSPAVRDWFDASFAEPTPAQIQGWEAIASGEHTLILAPTGSGKTLAAFLWGIDRLCHAPAPDPRRRTRILYLSPLRALAVDVERNLRAPLDGIARAAERLGEEIRRPTVGIRTGDTPADERRRLARNPPEILITTPESLFLILTSKARESLAGVDTVIVDEIHAMAATKRGSHLALSLERLVEICDRSPQRIGLSATQRPLDEIGRFLGGYDDERRPRPVTIVDAGIRKPLDIEVIVPVEDMGSLGEVIDRPVDGASGMTRTVRSSIWPSIHPRLLELVCTHRSTLVFVNARRGAERLATRLNELAHGGENRGNEAVGRPPVLTQPTGPDGSEGPADLVKAHHGSLSRERRLIVEEELKSGRLRGLVATSSLELGIDMGAVDLVVQIESPGSVAHGLQRIGRAGHQVGEPSRGRIFPKHRGDLVEAAVVVARMYEGRIEETHPPRNPLDVLAQQIVAMAALDEWTLDRLARVVRRSAPFAELGDELLAATLDLLDGRYPSERFAELRPRIVWDRAAGTIRGRAGAQRLAVTNPGTIPDRGQYGVFLPDGTRVGELDEEMVFESRVGETFLLGATTWRIDDISHDRVVVVPAPGEPGRMPFWHGEGPGRPAELGEAIGAFVRELRAAPAEAALERLRERHHLDELAAKNLLAYLDEQVEATGAVPDDRTILIERFRDEIGDWRVCILSPLGSQVHAPWAMALRLRLGELWGSPPDVVWGDDGIAVRLPETTDELPLDQLVIDPDEIDELLLAALPQSALFASHFRECAARALLLPRRHPGRRTALWQQRQRAADLLGVASEHPEFPILLETTRELLNDVFDVPALRRLLDGMRSRSVRVVQVETPSASPFARSLIFSWVAAFMYAYDAPLAERRAAALTLDRDLLRELLGSEELRELLDPAVILEVTQRLQHLADGWRARDADEVADLLRALGPCSIPELTERSEAGAAEVTGWVDGLVASRRVLPVVIVGEERFAAAEDAARLRDALGLSLPDGFQVPAGEAGDDPVRGLVARYALSHGPFTASEVAARYGLSQGHVMAALSSLEADGRLLNGELLPNGRSREWCDPDVLRQIRRRTLAALRREIEPVEATTLARFLPAWQGVGSTRKGIDALAEVVAQLQGAAIPFSVLEADVLPARLGEYRPSELDALCASGDLVWVGAGPLGATDGRIRLVYRDQARYLLGEPGPELPEAPTHAVLLEHLGSNGASFWPELQRAVGGAGLRYGDDEVLAALWDLVWAGLVTNDSMAAVRALRSRRGRRAAGSATRSGRGRSLRLARSGPPAGVGRWSLVAALRDPRPAPAEALVAQAEALLERYGVLTREAALGEGAAGGFAGVYPALSAMEERGKLRRGYFVAGLGAAQFALPGAVEMLRSLRDRDSDGGWDSRELVVLAATDPAQPYGAAVAWPAVSSAAGRPARAVGAFVVLAGGVPVAYLERGGRSVLTFAGEDDADWPAALAGLVARGRFRSLEVIKVDGVGVAALDEAVRDRLVSAGFVSGYRGLVLRGR